MKKLFLTLIVSTFCSLSFAESVSLGVNQDGDAIGIEDLGCRLLQPTFGTIAASTVSGTTALHWVMLSSAATADLGSYAVFSDSSASAASEIGRVYVSTLSTIHKFNPPVYARNNLIMSVSKFTVRATACYTIKSTDTVRVATAVGVDGSKVRAKDSGCVPSVIGPGGDGASAVLIATTPTTGLPPASSAAGTIVYWVQSSSVATGTHLLLRSTDTANTSSTLAVPGISLGSDYPLSGPHGGSRTLFDPPFRVLDRISYNLDTAGPQVTICTRGVREF